MQHKSIQSCTSSLATARAKYGLIKLPLSIPLQKEGFNIFHYFGQYIRVHKLRVHKLYFRPIFSLIARPPKEGYPKLRYVIDFLFLHIELCTRSLTTRNKGTCVIGGSAPLATRLLSLLCTFRLIWKRKVMDHIVKTYLNQSMSIRCIEFAFQKNKNMVYSLCIWKLSTNDVCLCIEKAMK